MKVALCANPKCRKVMRGVPRKRKYCSHRCDIACRDKQALAEQGRKGVVNSRLTRQRQAIARWQAKYPEVPLEVAQKIYNDGYSAGHKCGTRGGYRKGWAHALGERWERSA